MTSFKMTLAQAARATGAKAEPGWGRVNISGISTDTRTIGPGDLFVALKGEKHDGHDYLHQAMEKGALAVMTDIQGRSARKVPDLKVPDTLTALGDLASFCRQRPRKKALKVLAVTGSNGKTTTKEMLARIISRRYQLLVSKGNFNNLVGLPLTLFGLRPEHEAALLEMGMNHPGEIARLTEIADPDVGLVTNIGPAHIEGLGNIVGVAQAKGELYANMKSRATAVVNLDDPLAEQVGNYFTGRHLTFGLKAPAEVRPSAPPLLGLKGTRFTLLSPAGNIPVEFSLLGIHNVMNAAAAAASALALGMSNDDISEGLADFPPYPGRLELKHLPGPVYLLDDTYNANPESVKAAMTVLRSLDRGRGRRVAALGDMLELGKASHFEHDLLGRSAAAMKLDLLAAVGPEAKKTAQAARKHGLPSKRVAWFEDAVEAADWLKNRVRPYDRVLVKGSRGMRMERIVERLREEMA